MTSRVSIPLTICLVAAALTIYGLTRSPSPPSPAAEPAPAAAASDSSEPIASVASVASTTVIDISGFDFTPGAVVTGGQTIEVANADGAPHTLTSTDGLFDTGIIDGNGTGSFVAPTAPGTYSFFCELHPSMRGEFTVDS